MYKRQFLGQQDPYRITLTDVFDNSDQVVFSTPFDEQGRVHKVFVEAPPHVAEFLAGIFFELISKSFSGGRWCGVIPLEKKLVILAYDRLNHPLETRVHLLSQILLEDMALICDLRVSDQAILSVVYDGIKTCTTFVKLREGVLNGSQDLPLIDLPKIYPA